MAPNPDEYCENCLKHDPRITHAHANIGHSAATRCDRCLTAGENLQKCGACKLIRYCSRGCQKAHWREHKRFCMGIQSVHRIRKALGPTIEARQVSFEKWCIKHTQMIFRAGLSALGLYHDRKRIDTHAFLVHLHVIEHLPKDASSKPTYTRSILTARCVTMAEMHLLLDWRHDEGAAGTVDILAPRPGCMRVLIVDAGLPPPLDTYTMPCNLGDPEDKLPGKFDPHWLEHLMSQ